MNDELSDFEKLKYEMHRSERTLYFHALIENAKSFDRTILALSSGAIAISLTYISQVPLAVSYWWTLLVYAAWFFWLLDIIFLLVGFFSSQAATERYMEVLDNRFLSSGSEETEGSGEETGNPENQQMEGRNKPKDQTKLLNKLSALFFVVGVVCFLVFVSINSPVRSVNEMPKKETKASQPKRTSSQQKTTPKTQQVREQALSPPAPVKLPTKPKGGSKESK